MNLRSPHISMDARITVLLRELEAGPLSATAAAHITKWRSSKARDALEIMLQRGLVVEAYMDRRGGGSGESARGRVYALPGNTIVRKPKPTPQPRGIPAAKITIPQYRWGATRLG